MKRVVLIPLVASAVLMGCQDSKQPDAKQQIALNAEKQVAPWVGQYEGTTPCLTCLSRCEDCPGMVVGLTLHEDKTYTLTRESLSQHSAVETYQGKLRFSDESQQKIELLDVAARNLIFVDLDKHQLEIRADESGKRYQMQDDFLLEQRVTNS